MALNRGSYFLRYDDATRRCHYHGNGPRTGLRTRFFVRSAPIAAAGADQGLQQE